VRTSCSAGYCGALSILGPFLSSAGPARTKAVDPDFLVVLAEMHGLSGLLYVRLSQAKQLDISGEAICRLRKDYLATVSRSLCLIRELSVVRDILPPDIPLIALKGMSLLRRVYTFDGMRQMSDIDLLVPRERFDEANRLLAQRGYLRAEQHVKNFDPVLRAHLWQTGTWWTPADARVRVSIDIHDRLQYFGKDLNPAVMDEKMAGIWQRSLPHPVFAGISVMSPEDELLYLCVHAGILHIPLRPVSVCDVDLLIRQQAAFDWDAFLARTLFLDAAAPVLPVLQTACRLLSSPVPLRVLNRLSAACRRRVERFLVGWAAQGSRFSQHLYYLFKCRRPSLRYALVRAYFHPPEAFLRTQAGTVRSPLAGTFRRFVTVARSYRKRAA